MKKSLSALAIAGFFLSLLSVKSPAAAQALVVTSTSPRPNALSVSPSLPVTATLSARPSAATLSVFSQQAGGKKSGVTTVSGNTISFAPTVDFRPGETVTAMLTSASGAPAHVWQFTAATSGGTGIFGTRQSVSSNAGNLEVGDIDGDGDADVLVASPQGVNIHLNSGAGQLTAGTTFSVSELRSVQLADLDSNGSLDLLATTTNASTNRHRFVIYRNSGTGTFTQSFIADLGALSEYLSRVAFGDVDGDGDLDLLYMLTSATTQLVTRLNNGTGTFGAPIAQAAAILPSRPVQLMLRDIDNDNDLDVVSITTDISGSVNVYVNNGQGAFTSPSSYPVSTYSGGLAVGDIDGDGDLDIATPTFDPAAVVNLLLNDGSGSFTAGPAVSAGSAANQVSFGDLNGDGMLDMVVLGNRLLVLMNTGNGIFRATPMLPLPPANEPASLLDMDGDGDLDIVTRSGSTLYVYFNDDLVTSTKTALKSSLQVWPNPVVPGTDLHLTLPTSSARATAQLSTLCGQLVRTFTFAGTTAALSTSNLPGGVYLLTVQPENQLSVMQRIVVE